MNDLSYYRSDSPQELVIPSSGPSMQISPNLEALLKHDELTRQAAALEGSTLPYYRPSLDSSFGFAISLPPPPPRAGHSKKSISRDTRPELKKATTNVTGPGHSSSAATADAPRNRPSPVPSRAATPSPLPGPNPYINPAPLIKPAAQTECSKEEGRANTLDLSPTQSPLEPMRSRDDARQTPSHKLPDDGRGFSIADQTSQRSYPALAKVEKILGRGKGFFPGSNLPSNPKDTRGEHASTHKHGRPGSGDKVIDLTATSLSDMRQVRVIRDKSGMSHQRPTFGIGYTASVSPHLMTTPSQSSQPSQPSSASSPEVFKGLDRPPASHAHRNSDSSTRSHSSNPAYTPGTDICVSISNTSIPTFSKQGLRQNHMSRPMDDTLVSRPLIGSSNDSASHESFMDLFSPSTTDFDSSIQFRHDYPSDDSSRPILSPQRLQLSPIEYSSVYSNPSAYSSSTSLASMVFAPASPSSPQYDKPPVPTSSKPSFNLSQHQLKKSSPIPSPSPPPQFTSEPFLLPPTTNILDANERAGRIRRNRKLAQLFGRAPGANLLAVTDKEEVRSSRPLPQLPVPPLISPVKHRHAMSVSVPLHSPSLVPECTSPWQLLDNPWSSDNRRHSAPLSPQGSTFSVDSPTTSNNVNVDRRNYERTQLDETILRHRTPSRNQTAASPTSFIDLSDEDVPNDDVSAIIAMETPKKADRRQGFPYSPSTPSLIDGMSPEELAERERRRKRDKLAKLHRFLGSRVPADLVLGPLDSPSLPPTSFSHSTSDMSRDDARKAWVRQQRRSSSAGALPMGSLNDHFDRIKEELGEEEKALNVRRAQKMEKVFGIPPPQTLYHTRHSPSISTPPAPQISPIAVSIPSPFILPSDLPASPQRNPNQSAYTKLKGRKSHRPGTSESTQNLLRAVSPSSPDAEGSHYTDVLARSTVYMNYHFSLNSLTDIINRDDRESLAELHRYLHSELLDSPIEEQPAVDPRRLSLSSSLKSERRRSLPTRTSMASISSEFTLPVAKPEASDFQMRRRRAAKLTHFFGVDYHELIHDVLESIEKGVDEERKRGTLQPEEVEVLLHKLRTLKTKRNGLF